MHTIELGDKVRHRTISDYNAHLMEVMETDENKILCSYFDHLDKTTKEKWFEETELVLVSKAEGEFF